MCFPIYDDNNAEILPHPSRKATLESRTLERYAQKLQNLLMSFRRQTRFEVTQSMVNTLITDNFHTNIHDKIFTHPYFIFTHRALFYVAQLYIFFKHF